MDDIETYLDAQVDKVKSGPDPRGGDADTQEANEPDVSTQEERDNSVDTPADGQGRDGAEEVQEDEDVHKRSDKDRKRGRRSRSRDRDRDRDRDKRRGGRTRSRSKDRDRKSRRSRSKDRDRNRDSGSSRRHHSSRGDRDRSPRRKSRSRSRGRDRDRDRRHRRSDRKERHFKDVYEDERGDRDDRDKSRDKDRDQRRRSPSASKSESPGRKGSANMTQEERDAAAKQAAIDELTRDQRTVFVNQLTMKVRESDLKKYFGQLGKVNNVIMLRDKFTNRHKGFAYVEMKDLDAVPLVLQLNNQAPEFQKFPIMIKASEAEKNYLAKQEEKAAEKAAPTPAAPDGGEGNKNDFKLHIGNLHPNITDDDLREITGSFGEVTTLTLHHTETGESKGFAFVTYKKKEGMQACLDKLDGLEVAGKALKVSLCNTEKNSDASANWKLDADEGTGMRMDSSSRATLMARLGGASGPAAPLNMPAASPAPSAAASAALAAALNPAASGMLGGMHGMLPAGGALMDPMGAHAVYGQLPMQQAPGQVTGQVPGAAASYGTATNAPPPILGAPSFCVLVTNMFDPATETEEGWDQDIKEDLEEECSKHGTVMHSFVETREPGGLVYVLFSSVAAAQASAQTLHGRWFAGRMVSVSFMTPQMYVAKFPEAAKAVQTAMATAANAS